MSNFGKRTKNSGTQATSYIINFTESKMFPRCALKNVEPISFAIGGSHDPKVATFQHQLSQTCYANSK